jgi:pimeloyl-ACP methyl ester carboxylesterase
MSVGKIDVREWRLPHPLALAGLEWAAHSEATPRLALHGWLDNAAAMQPLLSALHASDGAHALSLDLPGHGMSDHTEAHVHAPFVDYVDHALRALNACFGSETCVDLIGHSMGGGIATLLAASFPERVRRLVLLDAIGPLSAPTDRYAADLRAGIAARHKVASDKPSYATLDAAVQARTGHFGIEREQVLQFIERSLLTTEQGLTWRSDSRLMRPSPMRFCEAQIENCINAIQAPTLMLMSNPRSSFLQSPVLTQRLACWQARGSQIVEVEANHHLQLGRSLSVVTRLVADFLS